VLHAARCKCRAQKSRQNRHLGTTPQLCPAYIFAIKACIDNRKKIVKQQYLLYMSHSMVNFGPLAAEIVSLVWGTPGNFNGFRVLAALLYGTLVVNVNKTAALNRGRHLYSAGQLSRWALAHICRFILFLLFSSPNLSVRRLDVYHTSTHGVALVRI